MTAVESGLEDFPRLLVDGLDEVDLFRVKRGDGYWSYLKRIHYANIQETIGRQLHYLVLYHGHIVGAITAAQSIWSSKPRDVFWGLNTLNREFLLNNIICNTFFRLEGRVENLGTRVLRLWRIQSARDWEQEYGDRVMGFETMVEPPRTGAMYLADNWVYVGDTAGFKKSRAGQKLYGVDIGELFTASTTPKLIFCRWADNKQQSRVDRSTYPVVRHVDKQEHT